MLPLRYTSGLIEKNYWKLAVHTVVCLKFISEYTNTKMKIVRY